MEIKNTKNVCIQKIRDDDDDDDDDAEEQWRLNKL